MKKGRVIINRNICDNAKECGGIEVCPTGAMYWDEENEMIGYKATECIDCGLCADSCPVEAILWGTDDEDYERKKKEVEEETRTLEELNVERYGAAPIEDFIENSGLDDFRNKTTSPYILLEFFKDESIHCLLHSIRVEEIKALFGNGDDVAYTKVCLSDEDVCNVCKVNEFPALVVLKDGNISGVIEGYYDDEQKEEFFKKLVDLK